VFINTDRLLWGKQNQRKATRLFAYGLEGMKLGKYSSENCRLSLMHSIPSYMFGAQKNCAVCYGILRMLTIDMARVVGTYEAMIYNLDSADSDFPSSISADVFCIDSTNSF
jgi:hypothetical protein